MTASQKLAAALRVIAQMPTADAAAALRALASAFDGAPVAPEWSA